MNHDAISEMTAAVPAIGFTVRSEFVGGRSEEVRIRVSKGGETSLQRVPLASLVACKSMDAVRAKIARAVQNGCEEVVAAEVVQFVGGLGQQRRSTMTAKASKLFRAGQKVFGSDIVPVSQPAAPQPAKRRRVIRPQDRQK